MEPGQGEFSLLFLHSILSRHRADAHPSLEHEPLSGLNAVLKILSQIAPAHHLELPRGIIGPQAIEAHDHLGHRCLVVLGVADLGSFQHLHLYQAVIHAHRTIGAPILMHVPTSGVGAGRLWLIAGTGEGPVLTAALLRSRWRVLVSVVSRAAALAYGNQPGLEVRVGAIGGDQPDRRPESGVGAELERALRDGDPFRWVIDATHPFASRISTALATECPRWRQPLLRLRRPALPPGRARILTALSSLGEHCPAGERLLLAIGARQLATAVRQCPEAIHHARVLPQPGALRQAMAAGLAPDRLACLRPGSDRAIEQALCRQWRIGTVLCRRSGSTTELHWHRVSEELGLRLLLLERPGEPAGVPALSLEAMLEKLTDAEGLAPCRG